MKPEIIPEVFPLGTKYDIQLTCLSQSNDGMQLFYKWITKSDESDSCKNGFEFRTKNNSVVYITDGREKERVCTYRCISFDEISKMESEESDPYIIKRGMYSRYIILISV